MSESERSSRAAGAEVLARRIARVDQDLETASQEKAALELAYQALTEEPRKLTLAELLLEFVPYNAVTPKSHCSECSGVFIGYTDQFKFCPLCGSQIVKVNRESSPKEYQERSMRERLNSVFKETCVNG